MPILLTIGLLLLAAGLASTPADRAAARARLKPWEPWLIGATVILWGVILIPMIFA